MADDVWLWAVGGGRPLSHVANMPICQYAMIPHVIYSLYKMGFCTALPAAVHVVRRAQRANLLLHREHPGAQQPWPVLVTAATMASVGKQFLSTAAVVPKPSHLLSKGCIVALRTNIRHHIPQHQTSHSSTSDITFLNIRHHNPQHQTSQSSTSDITILNIRHHNPQHQTSSS